VYDGHVAPGVLVTYFLATTLGGARRNGKGTTTPTAGSPDTDRGARNPMQSRGRVNLPRRRSTRAPDGVANK
jgi:hypothetical protein